MDILLCFWSIKSCCCAAQNKLCFPFFIIPFQVVKSPFDENTNEALFPLSLNAYESCPDSRVCFIKRQKSNGQCCPIPPVIIYVLSLGPYHTWFRCKWFLKNDKMVCVTFCEFSLKIPVFISHSLLKIPPLTVPLWFFPLKTAYFSAFCRQRQQFYLPFSLLIWFQNHVRHRELWA